MRFKVGLETYSQQNWIPHLRQVMLEEEDVSMGSSIASSWEKEVKDSNSLITPFSLFYSPAAARSRAEL